MGPCAPSLAAGKRAKPLPTAVMSSSCSSRNIHEDCLIAVMASAIPLACWIQINSITPAGSHTISHARKACSLWPFYDLSALLQLTGKDAHNMGEISTDIDLPLVKGNQPHLYSASFILSLSSPGSSAFKGPR